MIDIETSPNLGWVWSLWNQNVGLKQLVLEKDVLCFAAEWLEKPYRREFHAVWQPGGKRAMMLAAQRLLDEADAVIHYNGTRFDVPHLQGEMWKLGIDRPSGWKNIDLLQTFRTQFKLASNKLEHVTKVAGLASKLQTGGFELWLGVMAGEEKAQRKMERYCRNDVTIMRELYYSVQQWIPNHPNRALYGDDPRACPRCGDSDSLESRGTRKTSVASYPRYRCTSCGGWSTGTRRLEGVTTRAES